ncbi:hypothetical protein [Vibrio sp. F74]|uniref:hypothetical protein n=1 Tax=Vibrio sp. F74 TaxID=700020 RepID=UPI0035F553DE
MKQYLVLFSGVAMLSGCQLTPKADVNETYNIPEPIEVSISIDSSVPSSYFQQEINKRLSNNGKTFVNTRFVSNVPNLPAIYTTQGYEHDSITNPNFARYVIRTTSDQKVEGGYDHNYLFYKTEDGNHKFYLKADTIEGGGYGFTDSSSKLTQFSFSELENQFRKNLNELNYISYTNVQDKVETYNGTSTLKNDDVTAFANIQRIYKGSYLSTNTKTDSEKGGSFVVGNTRVAFVLYPYKNVSKLEFSFEQKFTETQKFNSFNSEDPLYEQKYPLKTTYVNNFDKPIIKEFMAAFNN